MPACSRTPMAIVGEQVFIIVAGRCARLASSRLNPVEPSSGASRMSMT